MALADTTALTIPINVPKMLFLSQSTGTVIYAKIFDEEDTVDPALVACSLNAIAIFVKNTFKKTSILSITIDEIGMRNLCIDDINITYLYEGSYPLECPLTELAERIVATDVWSMLMDVQCRVSDELMSQLDLLIAELFG